MAHKDSLNRHKVVGEAVPGAYKVEWPGHLRHGTTICLLSSASTPLEANRHTAPHPPPPPPPPWRAINLQAHPTCRPTCPLPQLAAARRQLAASTTAAL